MDKNVDFKNYDNDGDGYVDFVYVIYAGFGEADSQMDSVIWPHAWDVRNYRYRHDGKYIGRYACGCEMNYISKVYDGIGTFCHEFSHVLGLPDLYYTAQSGTAPHTLSDWDIMDYGPYNNDGNTPPAYSAYERFYMGWLTPRLLTEPEYVTLAPLNEGDGESLVVATTDKHPTDGWDPNPTTFYMLEVRTKSGWDAYTAGAGMLITKIAYNSYAWKNNIVNNDYRSMGVDLQEAKANSGKTSASTDAFPAGATEWTALTNHEITGITRNSTNKSVSFSYRGAEKPSEEVEIISDGRKAQKILHNGQVIIVRDGKLFDILGRQL